MPPPLSAVARLASLRRLSPRARSRCRWRLRCTGQGTTPAPLY